jgi:uncharacterized protein involved in exopolysaccharide biosynthesis
MENESLLTPEMKPTRTPSVRDFLAIAFRHRRLVIFSFLAVLVMAGLYAFRQPPQYQAEMKILVKRERVDPLVTAETNASPKPGSVTEEELNSETYLITSRDLIEKVTLAAGPQPKNNSWLAVLKRWVLPPPPRIPGSPTPVPQLPGVLQVDPVKKSNIIDVTYTSSDPEYSARVLNVLADLYLEKHLAVHRPSGAFEFFQQETERYRKGLAMIETRLSDPNSSEGMVSSQLEKDLTLKALPTAEAKLRETQEMIADTEERIHLLEKQLAATSPRLTTNVRTTDNRGVLENLKSNLWTLELKRTELLGKYEPGYRAVQEVENQIAQIRAAMAEEEKVSLKEETSDQNPVYQMIMQDLLKAKSQLAGLRATEKATAETARNYREKARQLDQKEMVQHDLLRTQKLAEDNYQLYLKKQEEVRISNELDRQRIVNVAIAEKATVPTDPYGTPKPVIVLGGGLLASFMSLALAFFVNQLDPTFKTPDELEAFLKIPVLAAIPINDK